MSDVAKAVTELQGAMEGYSLAREYDSIDLYEKFTMSRLGQMLRQADIEFDPNFCGVVINARNNRMIINSITGPDDEDGTDPTTDVLNEIWDKQQLDIFWTSWQRDALRDGDGYLFAWPKPIMDDEGNEVYPEADAALLPDQINITYVDPMCGRLHYSSADPRVKDFWSQMWSEPGVDGKGEAGVRWRLNLLYVDRLEKYATAIESESYEPKPEDFKPWIEADGGIRIDSDEQIGDFWPEENPYGEIPAYHLRTGLQYGKPVHANAFAPQDSISKLIEMMMVTVSFQGWPQWYALQEAENLGNQSIREDPLANAYVGDPDDFDDEQAQSLDLSHLQNGDITNETGTDLEATPGGMMIFKNFKEVAQMTPADPGVFLEPFDKMALAISTTTDTPSWMFPSLGGAVPSGESLKMINLPLNSDVRRLTKLFASALRGALGFSLRLCGIPDVVPTIEWEPIETVSEEERWTLVKLRTDAGVPYLDAMMMAGIPRKKALEWNTAREQQQQQEADHALALASAGKDPAKGAPEGPPVKK